jgi:Mn-containing catalase
VHHLQGKAERVKTPELLDILRAFHREKLTLRQRHAAVARHVTHYDFNNTYQYIINREDVHLQWLEAAIAELQGSPDDVAEPDLGTPKKKAAFMPLVEQDARDVAAFVDRWHEPVDALDHARHRGMMKVILGEMLEQKRFFEQMIAGREDLLGRRADGAGTGGGVLPTRWLG